MGGAIVSSETPVVIVARNSLALTKRAVKSVLAQDVPCSLLVVNNASTDGTGPWLRTKEFYFAEFSDLRSLAACWNCALKTFWFLGFDRALVLNNDVEIRPDTIWGLSAYHELFVTGIGVDKEDLGPRSLSDLIASERPHPDFSCFMISREVTDKVGWFDEAYFPAYCEDADYHVRMHRAGIKAVSVDLPFLHYSAGTLKNASPAEAARIRRGADSNRERFRVRYGCLPGTSEYQELFR
jgi:glycosyltransferase involved in cell wall biosynthesis